LSILIRICCCWLSVNADVDEKRCGTRGKISYARALASPHFPCFSCFSPSHRHLRTSSSCLLLYFVCHVCGWVCCCFLFFFLSFWSFLCGLMTKFRRSSLRCIKQSTAAATTLQQQEQQQEQQEQYLLCEISSFVFVIVVAPGLPSGCKDRFFANDFSLLFSLLLYCFLSSTTHSLSCTSL